MILLLSKIVILNRPASTVILEILVAFTLNENLIDIFSKENVRVFYFFSAMPLNNSAAPNSHKIWVAPKCSFIHSPTNAGKKSCCIEFLTFSWDGIVYVSFSLFHSLYLLPHPFFPFHSEFRLAWLNHLQCPFSSKPTQRR